MYFRFQGSVCLLLACLVAGIGCNLSPAFAEDPPTQVLAPSEWEVRIEAALDAKGEWEFVAAPLNDVCSAIGKKLGIDVVLDVKALEDFGIDSGTPITFSLRGISNRSCLRLLLRQLELTHAVRLGALWITTRDEAEAQLTTKVYPVSDLIEQDSDSGEPVVDYDSLEQAIMTVMAPNAWDQVGGPGMVRGIYGSLAVSQTEEIHEVVSKFLQTYRAVIESETDANASQQTSFMLDQQKNKLIKAALEKPLTAEFEDVALQEAIQFIGEAMSIPIVIDTQALEDFGIDSRRPINAKFKEVPLRFALARMLNELELTYTIRDEVLLITTPEVDESQLLIGLYPVRDLVQIAAAPPHDSSGKYSDFDSLIEVVTSTIAPDSWDTVGGPGAIEPLVLAPMLVVSQTQTTHEQISELLTKLRKAKKLATIGQGEFDPNAHIVRSYSVIVSQCTSDEIAKFVIRASEPETWNEEAGTFVQGLGGSVVVKHNASVHRRVQELLFDVGLGNTGGFGFGGASGTSGSTVAPETPPMPDPKPMGGGGFF